MSLRTFERRVRAASLTRAEVNWFPKWVDGYRQHCRLDTDRDLPITESLVIGFLRTLRDNQVAAWRRLQAARAIELYQQIVPGSATLDFIAIKRKLHEISRLDGEKQADIARELDVSRRFVSQIKRTAIEAGFRL